MVGAAVFAASAFATIPGDAPSSAISIAAVPFSIDGTLTPINFEGGLDYEMWYRVHLVAGHTINVTATVPGGGEPNFWVAAVSRKSGEYSFTSDPVDATTRHLLLLPNRTTDYYVNVWSSNPGTFTLSAAEAAPVPYPMSSFKVPATAKKNKKFTVSVVVKPDYDGFVTPVRFYIERKSGSKYKPYGYVNAPEVDGTSDWSKFAATFKLPKGTFHIRARFTDAVHPATYTKGWKTITVS